MWRKIIPKNHLDRSSRYGKYEPIPLLQILKELTGKTFIEYVNFIRLNRAELFFKFNMSVTEIAMCRIQ